MKSLIVRAIPELIFCKFQYNPLLYHYWSENPGLKNPSLDGIIVDEFGGGDDKRYPPITESIRRIHQNEQFRGKVFYPYCGSMSSPTTKRLMVRDETE